MGKLTEEQTGDSYNNPSYLCMNENSHNVLEKRVLGLIWLRTAALLSASEIVIVVISGIKKVLDFRGVVYSEEIPSLGDQGVLPQATDIWTEM